MLQWERLDYPIKKGYLTKQGVIRKNWRRRFFVVQPNYLIDYYENEEVELIGFHLKHDLCNGIM